MINITDRLRSCVETSTTATDTIEYKSQHNVRKPYRQIVPEFNEEQLRRFWALVDRRGPDECWPWLGHARQPNKNSKSYGFFHHSREFPHLRPHRISRTLLIGPFPDELDLDHVYGRCASTLCCNPAHTEPVPTGVNVQRYYLSRTHCKRGHEITEYGHHCRPCANLKTRERRAAKKTATITEAPIAALIRP